MNISATSGLIIMKFYHKHHWDWGKAAIGFWPDRIEILVSMETDSSHRVIMEKTVLPLFLRGERTGLVVRASDSGSGDPGSILGRFGVLFP